eukprot:comp21982_c0_seq1/m.50348 comp21982_c0_seq1/g.50348  ORF comp21982_c0_seq1/g.50348 comp21982_c0_seq1/m.50348 type:complete len:1108 (-) comp21982_c0_seq1:32-3355(-)
MGSGSSSSSSTSTATSGSGSSSSTESSTSPEGAAPAAVADVCDAKDYQEVFLCMVNKKVYRRVPSAAKKNCALPPPVDFPCPTWCASLENNIRHHTYCNFNQSTVYYSYRNTSCENVVLPDITHGACHLTCEEGRFLNAATSRCEKCPAGTRALSGGVSFEPFQFKTWPDAFRRECVFFDNDRHNGVSQCSGWEISQNVFHSGNLTAARSGSFFSSLKLSFNLVRRGLVRFRYRIDSGQGNYFGFRVNEDFRTLNSSRLAWVDYEVHLGSGIHTVVWEFQKYSQTPRSKNRAEIELIEIEGTRWTGDQKEECIPCPAGWIARDPGAFLCEPCPENTFAAFQGQSTCDLCPTDTFSGPGSIRCLKKRPCTPADYRKEYSQCDKHERTVKLVLNNNICIPEIGAEPAVTKEPCGKCPPGTEKDTATGDCVPCKDGFFSDKENGKCTACPDHLAAIKFLDFVAQDNWPYAPLNNTCEGACAVRGQGWIFDENGDISTGTGHGDSVLLNVTFAIEAYMDGQAVLNYSMLCPTTRCVAKFILDGEEYSISNDLDSAVFSHYIATHYLTEGNHTFSLVFRKIPDFAQGNLLSSESDKLLIHSLEFYGVERGGAQACIACDAGMYPRLKMCNLCEPGTFRPADSESKTCTACDANSVAPLVGSSVCTSCTYPQVAAPGRRKCIVEKCVLSPRNRPEIVYDLNPGKTPFFTTGIQKCHDDVFHFTLCDNIPENLMFLPDDFDSYSTSSYNLTSDEVQLRLHNPCLFSRDSSSEDDFSPLPVVADGTLVDHSSEFGNRFPLACVVISHQGKYDYSSRNAMGYAASYTVLTSLYDSDTAAVNETLAYLRPLKFDAETVNRSLEMDNSGFVVTYTGGYRYDADCSHDEPDTLNVTVLCYLGSGDTSPRGRFDPDTCHSDVVWYTPYGCRRCLASDLTFTYGPCNTTSRLKEKIPGWSERAFCNGELPTVRELVPCTSIIHDNSTDDNYVDPTTHTKISHISLMVLIAFMTLLLLLLLYFFYQNRKMYQQYTRVMETSYYDEDEFDRNNEGYIEDGGSRVPRKKPVVKFNKTVEMKEFEPHDTSLLSDNDTGFLENIEKKSNDQYINDGWEIDESKFEF